MFSNTSLFSAASSCKRLLSYQIKSQRTVNLAPRAFVAFWYEEDANNTWTRWRAAVKMPLIFAMRKKRGVYCLFYLFYCINQPFPEGSFNNFYSADGIYWKAQYPWGRGCESTSVKFRKQTSTNQKHQKRSLIGQTWGFLLIYLQKLESRTALFLFFPFFGFFFFNRNRKTVIEWRISVLHALIPYPEKLINPFWIFIFKILEIRSPITTKFGVGELNDLWIKNMKLPSFCPRFLAL